MSTSIKTMLKKPEWVLIFIICMQLFLLFCYNMHRTSNYDEFEAVHTSWKILNNERIYVDFFQHHHPYFYYLLLPFIKICGENIGTVIVLRILMYCLFTAIICITYLIARRISDSKAALTGICLLLAVRMFYEKGLELRPDVPQTLFGLLAILMLLIYTEKTRLYYLVYSACALGLSFLFLQKAVFLVFLFVLVLAYGSFFGKMPRTAIFWFCLFFGLTIIPYYAYLFFTDAVKPYWVFNWLVNMKLLERYSALTTLSRTIEYSLAVWLLYVISIPFMLRHKRLFTILFFSLGMIFSLFCAKTPYSQYLLPAFPLVAIIAGITLRNLVAGKTLIFIVIMAAALGKPVNHIIRDLARPSARERLDKAAYVLSITSPGDCVYDGDRRFNLFRRDVDFFWFSLDPQTGALAAYKMLTGYEYNVCENIRRLKPKVVSTKYVDNLCDVIHSDYRADVLYNDLLCYVTLAE
ncbi:MAG: glycosyltransferase family 39 protein [Planctomycetota bacterium]